MIDYTREDFTRSGRTWDLAFLGGLAEAGDVPPVVDRRYPLSEVPDAVA